MPEKYRIPITTITVFGASALLTVAVVTALYLGFNQAAQSTRQLWADQSQTLIDAMEQSLDSQLKPIRLQARRIAKSIHDLSHPAALDEYIFGALTATPQVIGVAVVTKEGRSRRWLRDEPTAIDEDWSQRPEIMGWINAAKAQNAATWRAPIWEASVTIATLLHDIPLHNDAGEFIGVFAQVIPIRELSGFLSSAYTDTGITPFVLYDKQFVLSHPLMISGGFSTTPEQPLPTIEDIGDTILSRLWTSDANSPFIADLMLDTNTSGTYWGDHYYLYLSRNINRYGPAPWTIGAYINTSLISGDDTERLLQALAVGFSVLLIAIAAAIVVGRKVSVPITAIASAADAVNNERLQQIPPLVGSRIRELDEASQAFNNMLQGLRERNLIRDTLGRFVPREVARSLLAGGGDLQARQTTATILFCDIESFTRLTESLGAVKIVTVLNAYFSSMVEILETHGGVVTQFQGDAILATFNVPLVNPNHANNALLCARKMLACVADTAFAGEKLNIRIGINTGAVVAGAIGAKGRLSYTVHGDAVNLAARLEAMNKEYGSRLLVSGETAALSQGFVFTRVGETSARGQSRLVELYTIANAA